jgi:tRNA-guanine transglycosylase
MLTSRASEILENTHLKNPLEDSGKAREFVDGIKDRAEAKGFSFQVLKEGESKGSRARLGILRTRHGLVETPCFVPVATLASVRSLDYIDLASLGIPSVLANTYHLHLRPGDELIRKLGGLHKFMAFDGPIFTDSGGFQAFSLGFGREHNISKIGGVFPDPDRSSIKAHSLRRSNLTKITGEGVHFKSLHDGGWHFLNPEISMRIQSNLGSDVIMAFDECTSPLSDYDYTKEAMERTHRWAQQSLKFHNPNQAIYGIIQGGWFEDLRMESTEFTSSQPFDGIAIGGSLGENKQDMHKILDWVIPKLDSRPRHLLGIGDVDDLFEGVERGIDTFDCVSPTRIARRGSLHITPQAGGCQKNKFRIDVKALKFKEDPRPIDPYCSCPTCQRYSRAYLWHLYHAKELSYFRLASIHNLHFMLRLMESIRESIAQDTFRELKDQWLGKALPRETSEEIPRGKSGCNESGPNGDRVCGDDLDA